jgi:hypothetical protein
LVRESGCQCLVGGGEFYRQIADDIAQQIPNLIQIAGDVPEGKYQTGDDD